MHIIGSFRCKETEKLFNRRLQRKFSSDMKRAVERKLEVLEAARTISDLRNPPSNRLEALLGDRKGQHGIRINKQSAHMLPLGEWTCL